MERFLWVENRIRDMSEFLLWLLDLFKSSFDSSMTSLRSAVLDTVFFISGGDEILDLLLFTISVSVLWSKYAYSVDFFFCNRFLRPFFFILNDFASNLTTIFWSRKPIFFANFGSQAVYSSIMIY